MGEKSSMLPLPKKESKQAGMQGVFGRALLVPMRREMSETRGFQKRKVLVEKMISRLHFWFEHGNLTSRTWHLAKKY